MTKTLYDHQGKIKEALQDYNKAIVIDPNYKDAYMNRGNLYDDQGKTEEALQDYNKAIAIDPNYKQAYMNRGNLYDDQGKTEEALQDYNKAITIDSNYKDAYYNRGILYYNQGKTEEALQDYNKAIAIDPYCKQIYNSRGILYKKQGKAEKALQDYNKAIAIDPDYKEAYNNRGILYDNQGKIKESLQDYNKAIAIDPNYKQAYNNRGILYDNQGKIKESLQDYNKAIAIDPDYKEVYNNRGILYYYQGKVEEALQDYSKAIAIDPDYKEVYNNRGILYYDQGKTEEALQDYNKAIAIDPNYQKAYNNRLLIIYKKQGKKEKQNIFKVKCIEVKSKDEDFYKYIETYISNKDIKLKIYDLFLSVTKLKDKFIYKDKKEICHYTKINCLKSLLKPETESEPGRLRLDNVSYMNDPIEGQVFIELLKHVDKEDELSCILEKLYDNKNSNNRQLINGKNNVFLCSFSSAIDSLPMWVQYSKDGEGCSLVFDSAFFDKEDKNSLMDISDKKSKELPNEHTDISEDVDNKKREKTYYCLYKIKYIDNNYDLDDDTLEFIKEIIQNLKCFKTDLENPHNDKIKEIIQNILDQVRFLFKDKNYDHEQEVRIIKFASNGDIKYTGDKENFRVPHVYIEMDRELELDEVILGPKVQDSKEIANYLYYTNRVKKVSKSAIKYQ